MALGIQRVGVVSLGAVHIGGIVRAIGDVGFGAGEFRAVAVVGAGVAVGDWPQNEWLRLDAKKYWRS